MLYSLSASRHTKQGSNRMDLIRIAFVSDLHYALTPNNACPCRMGHKIPELLDIFVEKLNTEIKPDLVLCGGDLINDPEAGNAESLLRTLQEKFSRLEMPSCVIRGNHDPSQEIFTKYFPFHKTFDVDFVRIVSFDDPEQPGYNALRTGKDLLRMKEAAGDRDRVIFSFQHTALTPPGECIFSYSNADEILQLMKDSPYRGTLSGHYHEGKALYEKDSLQFFVQRAFCENPFAFSLLNVKRSGIISAEQYCIEM